MLIKVDVRFESGRKATLSSLSVDKEFLSELFLELLKAAPETQAVESLRRDSNKIKELSFIADE